MIKDKRAALAVLFEYCYLVMVAVIALMAFNYTTMSGIVFPAMLHRVVLFGTALIVAGRYITAEHLDFRQVALALAIVVIFYIAGRNANQRLGELALLIVGARGLRFEKILRVYFVCILTAMILTVVLALSGVIENLVYARERDNSDQVYMRSCYGICSPTDLGAHVMYLVCCYAWLRERRMQWFELLIPIGAAAALFYMSDARCDAACLVVLAVGLIYVKLRRTLSLKQGKVYRMDRRLSFAMAVASIPAAVISLGLAYIYDPHAGWMRKLNAVLSKRLDLSHRGVSRYPLTLFGQFVKMNGWGGNTEYHNGYFWIDCSYIITLLQYGVLVLGIAIAILTVASFRQRKIGSWERLGILTLVAVQCMVEHHLTEISYNPFLLLAFAAVAADTAAPVRQDPRFIDVPEPVAVPYLEPANPENAEDSEKPDPQKSAKERKKSQKSSKKR